MTPAYVPFTPERRKEVLAELATRVATLDELTRLRARLSGNHRGELLGLRAIFVREAGFAGRFFGRMLPSIVGSARELLVRGDPSLATHAQGSAARTSIPRAEAAGWVAHMFFGTLPTPSPLHPGVDFTRILESERPQDFARLRCMLDLFERAASAPLEGRFEVERVVVPARTAIEWAADASPLGALAVDEAGFIEDAVGHLQVDFANRYLGGGVLTHGCVQEEILFSVIPELLSAMLVSPRMRDDEAIVMRGAERFARAAGYADTLEYGGQHRDATPRRPDGAPDRDVVAIDAIDYRRGDPDAQLREGAVLRELAKARAGFRRDARGLPVATGNWGCGAFRGDHALKAVIQWVAASAEGRDVRYFSFGDARLGPLEDFARSAARRHRTVGSLAARLFAVAPDGGGRGLYERLLT